MCDTVKVANFYANARQVFRTIFAYTQCHPPLYIYQCIILQHSNIGGVFVEEELIYGLLVNATAY